MPRIDYNNGYYEGDVNYSGEEHGYGTFYWNNGEKYIGQFQNRKFHGQGTYYYENGNKYVGQWKNDARNGKGIIYFHGGGSYDGEWLENKRNGYGKEIYTWGYYEGYWKDNDYYGQGKEYHTKDGVSYEGNWQGSKTATNVVKTVNGKKYYGKIANNDFVADALNGNGREDYNNGYYIGEFLGGKRHGYGTYYWNDGAIYQGYWEADLKNGYGKLTSGANAYEGNWKDDKREGFGKQTGDWGAYTGFWKGNSYFGPGKEVTKKGETFEGVWTDSDNASFIMYCYDGVLQHGYMKDSQFYEDKEPGIFAKTENYNNGSYHGIIKNGKRNGYGVYTWSSGSRYQGNWVDDVRIGYGRFFWTDGGRYEGMWKNDKMNGMGVYYSANGSYYAGEWKDDNKYRGKQFYSWGTYEGEWANKTWCGYGKEVVYNGATFEGLWKDAKNAVNVTKTSQDGKVTKGKIVDGTFVF